MNTNELLRKLLDVGFSKNEALFYVTATTLGTFTLAEIARDSKVKRTTCYSVAESLQKKGYVVVTPDSKTVRYAVIDPRIVFEKLHASLAQFHAIVPILTTLKSGKKQPPKVEVYYGIEGVKTIHNLVVLDKPKLVETMINVDYVTKQISADIGKKWISELDKHGIQLRSLRPQGMADTTSYSPKKQKGREVRFLPQGYCPDSMLFIWVSKIAFMSTQKEGVSFVVQSPEFLDMIKMFYEIVWGVSVKL